MQIEPVKLVGKFVRLEPLSDAHVPSLAKVGLDEKIWRYMRYRRVTTVKQLHDWVRTILDLQSHGTDLAFTVIDPVSGEAIGCTRYLNIDIPDRSVEIGGTWYGLAFQGTLVNTECKYLLLKHAFDVLDCIRVWMKTDSRNLRSQRAIEKLGMVKEGVLRNHMILPDGYIRDSIVYSMLPDEWLVEKQRFEALLSAQ
jgi:RimJ/RimL family protein N-acetyltransferase